MILSARDKTTNGAHLLPCKTTQPGRPDGQIKGHIQRVECQGQVHAVTGT